jgi:hypothetical protein
MQWIYVEPHLSTWFLPAFLWSPDSGRNQGPNMQYKVSPIIDKWWNTTDLCQSRLIHMGHTWIIKSSS